MLFLTAFVLGAASLALRSAAACLAVAGLVLAAFVAAGAPLPFSRLLAAGLGFNAGLLAACLHAAVRAYSGITR
ncbi:hypothetical protein [Shinella pollutisoli]|uniref:Uncharacterized protein n=1 Tax=Shinella pollutisoli TaxID=2250594 RepID=A0ABV7DL97_9HYPH|nr:hypothetical protein [Shinella pollutisoli]